MSVLLCTSLSPDKEYMVKGFWKRIAAVSGVADIRVDLDRYDPPKSWWDAAPKSGVYIAPQELDGGMDRVKRIAIIREGQRQNFLQGGWTHLFFLDADIIPPADVVERLLRHGAPIASGLVNIRSLEDVHILQRTSRGSNNGYVPSKTYYVRGCSMGCTMIDDFAASIASFDPDCVKNSGLGEDYQFCEDASKILGMDAVLMDATVCPWHVHSDRTANRIVVGEARPGAVWVDTPYQVSCMNRLWRQGYPQYDLTEGALPPGFEKGDYHPVRVETKQMKEIG